MIETVIICCYCLTGLGYLVLHPKRFFGATVEYPGYRLYHSVLKVTPFLLACYFDYFLLSLVVADLLFDGEYLTFIPKKFKQYFFLGGLVSWTLHHYVYFYYESLLTDTMVRCTLYIGLSCLYVITIKLIYRSGSTRPVMIFYAIYAITLLVRIIHHYYNLLTQDDQIWKGYLILLKPKPFSLLILGMGDLLLLASKHYDIPYKDQVTMLTSYIYVFCLAVL